jgi:hypothetical protein
VMMCSERSRTKRILSLVLWRKQDAGTELAYERYEIVKAYRDCGVQQFHQHGIESYCLGKEAPPWLPDKSEGVDSQCMIRVSVGAIALGSLKEDESLPRLSWTRPRFATNHQHELNRHYHSSRP